MFLALVELLSLVLFRAPALSLCKRVAVPFAVDVLIGRSSSVCSCIGTCKTARSPLSTTQVIFLCSVRCEVASRVGDFDGEVIDAYDFLGFRIRYLFLQTNTYF